MQNWLSQIPVKNSCRDGVFAAWFDVDLATWGTVDPAAFLHPFPTGFGGALSHLSVRYRTHRRLLNIGGRHKYMSVYGILHYA